MKQLTEVESNAGGGGERVLWTAISSIHRTERDIVVVVYSGDTDASKEEIIAKVKVNSMVFCWEVATGSLLFRVDLTLYWIQRCCTSSFCNHAEWWKTQLGHGSPYSARALVPSTLLGKQCQASFQIST